MPAARVRFHLALAVALLGACGDGCGKAQPVAPPGAATLTPEIAARVVELENRGIACLERYDYSQAVPPLREAAALAPGWLPGRIHLALALLHSGAATRPEARTMLAEIVRDHPDDVQARFLLAWATEEAGEPDAAAPLYRRAYELSGKDPVCGAMLGSLLASSDGHEEEALAILRDVHARSPALVPPVNQLMLLLRRTGRVEESDRFLEKLRALKGSAVEAVPQAQVGQQIRNAYGNMGPLSMARRNFAPPGTLATGPAAGAVTAKVEDLPGWRPGALTPGAPYLGAAALDFDADGDIDLFVCGGTGPCGLLRNDDGNLTDAAAAAGAALTGAYAVAAGEFDVDPSKTKDLPPGRRMRVDLVVLTTSGVRFLRNRGDGTFEDATAASGLAADPGGARAALSWDADQDGDLDLLLSAADGQTNRLWANRGPGVFVDATKDSGLAGDGGAYGPAVVLDFDEDLDLDLVVSRPMAPPAIFANDRMLRFHALAPPDGAGPSPHGALALLLDGDDVEDVVLLGDTGMTGLCGDGVGFVARASAGLPGGTAVDLDLRHASRRSVVFADGTWLDDGGVVATAAPGSFAGLANVLALDLDGDGAEEVVRIVPEAPLQRVTFTCERRGTAVVLDLEGVIRNDVQAGWSNLEGRGALVEVKAGAHWQQRRVGGTSGFGCSAPTRLVCGIGGATQADFVRILWPDAVQQAVLDVPSGAPQTILEEQRRPDSCPLLFSWDGERWVFVTDFLGVGGVGFLVAPGVYGAPDPTESVKIEAALVRPRGGKIVLKLVEAMEEVCYLDHCDLLVVDHPADVTVFPDERFAGEPPFPDGRLLAYRREILPVAARDGRGEDVLDRIAAHDRWYPDAFRLHPRLTGSTDEAVLELDFGDRLAGVAPGGGPNDGVVLYLDGWIEYGYTRTSVAAAGEGFEMRAPCLEAWDAAMNAWKPLVANLGYPAGFPRVMTYDVTGKVSRETPRLRIRTNFEIYWDRVWLGPKEDAAAVTRQTVLAAESARLAWVGYPREFSPDGRAPRIYDYGVLDPSMPWKTVPGEYTKFGDVTPLVAAADDMYVIHGKGEEVEVAFDASKLPPVRDGWARSFVLRTTGWCKGQEMYVAHGSTVEPLPFLGMSGYPYPEGEAYPAGEAHRAYRRTWNTRRVAVPAR